MNIQIESLHGRDMLHKIRLFESTRMKISHRTVDLIFLKNCRDKKIIPCFAKIKHNLKHKHEHAFLELSLSIVIGEIRRSRKELDTLSLKAYNLHTSLAKELRLDYWISVDAATTLKVERALEKTKDNSWKI